MLDKFGFQEMLGAAIHYDEASNTEEFAEYNFLMALKARLELHEDADKQRRDIEALQREHPDLANEYFRVHRGALSVENNFDLISETPKPQPQIGMDRRYEAANEL